jgi:hypothetical protein
MLHSQPLQISKPLVVRIVVIVLGAVLILTALPGRMTAQQNNAPATPGSSSAPASGSSVVPQIIEFNGQFSGQFSGQPGGQSNETQGGGAASVPAGTISIMFTLYENEQGGTALWSETQNVQVDAQGHYTALLGSTSPEGLPLSLFTTGQAHWLAVQPVGPEYAEQPRVLLVSAPYALKAGDAEAIGGLPASAFVRTDASPGTSGTTAVTTTASTVTAAATTAASVGSTLPHRANSLPPLQQYYNAGKGYKIGGQVVLALPGGGGKDNTALGYAALASNTTGTDNTASGYQALECNFGGSYNTATGSMALGLASGNNNTASGYSALYSNVGHDNTASG